MENSVATQPTFAREVSLAGGNIFNSAGAFELAQRMSKALASSSIVPQAYQNNVGNCMIALEMASRLNASPLMVMQNLHVINGRPAWGSQYIIAMINQSHKYKTELQFEISGEGDARSCTAYVFDKNDHRVEGPTISIQMAKDEGWYGKNGSKWKTMPDVMLRYRAAAFFGRLNCPEMIMGIYTRDEVIEIGEDDYTFYEAREAAAEEIEEFANTVDVDPDTGEISEPIVVDLGKAAKAAAESPDF